MKIFLKISSVIFPILLLAFFSSSANGEEGKTAGLFIMKDGKAFNGNFVDEFIKISTSFGEKTITSNEVISIYRDGSEIRLRWKQEILKGKIIGKIKVDTIKGSLIINSDDMVCFNKLITTPADKIGAVDIVEDHVITTWGKKKPSDKITLTLLTENWGGKVFTLSNPIYPIKIEDPTKPIEFSFNVIKHSDINEETVTILRIKGLRKGGGVLPWSGLITLPYPD